MMLTISHFFNYRPLSILSIAAGARDILLGLGFISGFEQIRRTLIYQNYDELVPGITGPLMGYLFILTGVLVIIGCAKYQRILAAHALRAQSFAWLFTTIMYCLNGHFLLAAIFGVFFMFPSGYLAYYMRYHPAIDEQLRNLMNQSRA